MKSFVFICLVAVVAAAAAAPPAKPELVVVKESFHDNIGIPDNYGYGLELSGNGKDELVPFTLVGYNDQTITGTYTADKHGHRPRQTDRPSGVKPAKVIKT